jgi:LmbE family N-acetylglucosaminyl deacetylase
LEQEKKINVIVFRAHPDDIDVKAGGMAIKFAELGHNGLFVRKAAHTYNEIKELFPMMK